MPVFCFLVETLGMVRNGNLAPAKIGLESLNCACYFFPSVRVYYRRPLHNVYQISSHETIPAAPVSRLFDGPRCCGQLEQRTGAVGYEEYGAIYPLNQVGQIQLCSANDGTGQPVPRYLSRAAREVLRRENAKPSAIPVQLQDILAEYLAPALYLLLCHDPKLQSLFRNK